MQCSAVPELQKVGNLEPGSYNFNRGNVGDMVEAGENIEVVQFYVHLFCVLLAGHMMLQTVSQLA